MDYLNGYQITDDDQETELWSANRLANGDAENDTVGWTGNDFSAVVGGATKDSTKAFQIARRIGTMRQTQPNTGAHPPSYLVRGAFLPEKAVSPFDPLVKIYARVTIDYGDGSHDEMIIPVREAKSIGAEEVGGTNG